jgi:LmbE family N-acetylglucosaminyl deacetylase
MSQTFNKSILSIHAHPDDTEAFASGALVLMKKLGYDITVVTMTAGGLGGINSTEADTIAMREKEAQKAAECIGANYACLGGRDGFLYDTEEMRIKTLQIIRKVKPGIIITHLPNDYHSDHRTTALIVEAAAMISSLPNAPVEEEPLQITPLLYHSAPLGLSDPLGGKGIEPHFFVDISSVVESKMEMLSHHHSQIELMRVMHKMDDFFGEMKKSNAELGQLVGVDFAECFWQHLGGGFQKENLLQRELASYLLNDKTNQL